jgi:hypothetical protein
MATFSHSTPSPLMVHNSGVRESNYTEWTPLPLCCEQVNVFYKGFNQKFLFYIHMSESGAEYRTLFFFLWICLNFLGSWAISGNLIP